MQNGTAISELLQKLQQIDASWESFISGGKQPDNAEVEKKIRLLEKYCVRS